jgi:ATPase family associated with various cellular activities (AAA)
VANAAATFRGGPDAGGRLNIDISYVRPTGQLKSLPVNPTEWTHAAGCRALMERAYLKALEREGAAFPYADAMLLHASLGWHEAMTEMLRARPSGLELLLNRQTCSLLPELCPAPDGDWLDRKLPIYRTLHHIARPARRQSDLSLAILYQDDDMFAELASAIRRTLSAHLDVELFPGRFLADPDLQAGQFKEIFLRHRGVLFLGHLHRPQPAHQGGWQLTGKPEDFLSLTMVESLLARVWALPGQKRPAEDLFIPELILTGCCSGSWGAPGPEGPNQFFYPEMFLNNGVRFFIGSWMPIVVQKSNINDFASLLEGFLMRWSRNPDSAAQALFEAKQACANPLLASLFHLYVAPDLPEAGDDNKQLVADRPLTGGLQPNTSLGPYLLVRELWQDRWARAFWAHHKHSGTLHIIQVLTDEWQDDPGVTASIRTAIAELKKAELPASQLVPDDAVHLTAGENSSSGPALLVLLYNRPGETEHTWSRLLDRVSAPGTSNHFQRVLELGAEISVRLSELHDRQVLHGNFDPAAVVFRETDGRKEVAIKDAWVQWVQPGRCTHARYAAPDAQLQHDGVSRLKVDCYGLGVLLFELAVGRHLETETSVRAAVGDRASFVPEALDRVVRGCLAPSASVRPSADHVARRLTMALRAGGTYLSDLGQELDIHIAAGNRLFAVRVDRVEDLQRVLEAMQDDPTSHYRYRLYTAGEHEGITDCQLRQTAMPWMGAAEIRKGLSQIQGDPGPIHPSVEAFVNASNLFAWIGAAAAHVRADDTRPEMPVILIRGNAWWQAPQLQEALAFLRVLKSSQQERHHPVVVIADSYRAPIGDSTPPFLSIEFPRPTPSELFERVLSAPESLRCEPLTPEQAAEIARRLFPCTTRELEESLKLCALRHSRIDHHVVDIRDENRARRFRSLGTLTYTPAARLPPFESFGWPPAAEAALRTWVKATNDGFSSPRRLLLTGPSGYGKTAAAHALVHELRLPLMRLDASACLQKNLGDSEQMLALSLEIVQQLGSAILLVDDLDRFIASEGAGAAADPTLIRMSSILSHWVDDLPRHIILVATATKALPAGWRRRFEMGVPLDSPRLDQNAPDSLDYRQAVVAALFRRFQLPDHAANRALLETLAAATCPPLRRDPLMAAVARVRPTGLLGRLFVSLRTGADLEAWMAETLLLHTPPDDLAAPERKEFWLNAVR